LRAGSQPRASAAWYQTSDKHIILATITLSREDDDSLVSHASSCL
jgi:hypothetical protein